MFDRIKSTPAKICLMVSALVTIVYSMNFMLFADCYVTGGKVASLSDFPTRPLLEWPHMEMGGLRLPSMVY